MCPDQQRTMNTVCAFPQCARNVWKDPDGSFSMFCGLTHRNAMAAQNNGTKMCKNCRQRPVYVENGREHEFCGRRCALEATQGTPNSNRSSATVQTPTVCTTPGCTRRVFVSSDGSASRWCSQAHRRQALRDGAEACLVCRQMPKATLNGVLSDYCSSRCGQVAVSQAPMILSINANYTKFNEVTQQFMDAWKHPTRCPTILKVWRIIGLPNLVDEHSRYKLAVERNRNLPEGNSKRRWHGTVRACKLGDDDSENSPCADSNCRLCRIIESSFKVAMYRQRTNFGRFGAGIYTSATSSKANDYVAETGGSDYKAMLLNDVVLGKAIKLTVDTPGLTEPPNGYDSVIGEPGNSLNYDEAIVYKNEAIRPLYLVIYY